MNDLALTNRIGGVLLNMERLSFTLHPGRTLIVAYLCDIDLNKVKELSDKVRCDEKVTLLRSNQIQSIRHVEIAANMALLRCHEEKSSIANETVICAAGSSNPRYALRDFGFVFEEKESIEEISTRMDVLVLAFDHTEDEIRSIIESAGTLADLKPLSELEERSLKKVGDDKYLKALMKTYKLTREDVEAFGIEQSIIQRVATKFVT